MKITIYTDGSSRGNPGPGGWAAILITDSRTGRQSDSRQYDAEDQVIELGGREDMTTNNRMELMGAIAGLREIGDNRQSDSQTVRHLESVEVCTDSEYVKKGITEWIDGWIKKGWKTSTKKPVLNQDLWEALKKEEDRLKKGGIHVMWKYVPGHAGVKGNERADEIATACADNASHLQLYRGERSEYGF
jgi:ribonuclease HI